MSLKIIELEIDDNLSGETYVSEIALVSSPAIERDFMFFKKQEMEINTDNLTPYDETTGTTENFVKPAPGEDKDDFISRCYKVLKNEGKPHDQSLAICYNYWEDGFSTSCGCENEEGIFMPCEIKPDYEDNGVELEDLLEEGWEIIEIKEFENTKKFKRAIAEEFNKIPKEQFYQIITTPSEDSILDYAGRKTRFVYVVGSGANLIQTSRQFCRRMLGGRQFVFRYEDVVNLSSQIDAESDNMTTIPRPKGTSVDIFEYKGGANCRHKWLQIILQPKIGSTEEVQVNNNKRRMLEEAAITINAPGLAGNVNPPVQYGSRSPQSVGLKQQFQSYSDYPDAVKNNAKRGIELNEKVNNKCATQVGKVRAQQLADGKPISEETIKRMYSYLSRAETYYDENDTKACGTISYLLWGGKAALSWSKNKVEQLEKFVNSAMGLSIGDYVSWTYAGRGEGDDRARGQIKDIRVQGKVKVPNTDFELTATEDRPVALIETKDGSIVGQYMDNLRQIQKPEEFVPDGFIQGLAVFKDKDKAVKYSELCGCNGVIEPVLYMNQDMFQSCSYKEKFKKFEFKLNDDKRLIYSPAMIPELLIGRIDEATNEKYFVKFTKETIRKMAYRFLIDKRTDKVNYEHTEEKFNGVYLVESWIVEGEKDKAYQLGYNDRDVPAGTWMICFRVDNDEVWNMVKKGEVKGISIEGDFNYVFNKTITDDDILKDIINIIKKADQ